MCDPVNKSNFLSQVVATVDKKRSTFELYNLNRICMPEYHQKISDDKEIKLSVKGFIAYLDCTVTDSNGKQNIIKYAMSMTNNEEYITHKKRVFKIHDGKYLVSKAVGENDSYKTIVLFPKPKEGQASENSDVLIGFASHVHQWTDENNFYTNFFSENGDDKDYLYCNKIDGEDAALKFQSKLKRIINEEESSSK